METKEQKIIANYKELVRNLEEYFQSYCENRDCKDVKTALDLIQAHKNIEQDINAERA
jgi:hypothetical protein